MAKQPDRAPEAENRKFKVREPLLKQLDVLAERDVTDVTDLVNLAVREMLERRGMWPPKPEDKEPK